jgi:hypothetical protein
MESPELMAAIVAEAEAEERRLAANPNTDSLELKDMAAELVALKDRIEELGAEKTLAQARYDHLRKSAIPDKLRLLGLISSDGRGSFNFAGGKLILTRELHVNVRAPMRESLIQYLRDHGAGDLVRETVNDATLKAHCRSLREEGKDLPPMVDVYEDQSVSLRRDKSPAT